ncbi:galactoside 2-alpha-L-fucosyltransferase-like [Curcuma longa]|uniref:galactoside 2-alpha-L-fucosyltransferase-like n=1 Tax=Curcuma longa TaxID=136217 RepID=UPI003D9F8C77
MAEKFVGGAATQPFLVGASLTVVVLLFVLSGTTRNLPLDLLVRSGSYSALEQAPRNCSAEAAAAAASTGDPASKPEKLLGGLLSPDFQEASCVSRYQSSLFWHSNRTPSSYLLHKLRSYEALHKKCGPNAELFNRSLQHLTVGGGGGGGGGGGNSECNYLVWLPSDGLGNQLIALVSTFLYALLNDRVLLLSIPTGLHGTFCEPFPDSSWALPSDFPIHNLDTRDFYSESPRSYGYLLKNKVISTEMASLPPYLYLHLSHDAGDSDKMFYCDDAQPLLQNFAWLFLRSNQYFAPALFLMPQYDQELSELFPEKETVFHHLGRYLLHPTNAVWGYVTRFYEAYLASAKDRVGIQVRIFPNAPVKFELMLDQIINCTLKEGILPETQLEAPASSSTPAMGTKPKAVLVASLQTGYSDTLQTMYYERATATGEVVGVYQPSHEELQHTEQQGHNAKALAEIFLLSFSDTLVTSAFSTFGYVAQALGGLRPWILLRPDNGGSTACRRASSMEPCFQFAPTYDCKAGRDVDKGKVVPHVRHCEDLNFDWGLKLFD